MPIAPKEIDILADKIFKTAKILAAFAPKEATTLEWKLTKASKEKLKLLKIGRFLTANDKIKTPVQRQIHLRKCIGPYLTTPANKRKHSQIELFKWIVRSWGNIKSDRGNEVKFGDWVKRMGNLSNDDIQNFLHTQGMNGIASWSKILSFSNYYTYAIYDARVAVSLNILLSHLGNKKYRFYLPPSQNAAVNPALTLLNKEIEVLQIKKNNLLEYTDYISLLKAMPTPKESEKLIKLEMFLFAIAPELSIKFWIGHREADDLLPRAQKIQIENNLSKPVKSRINALSGFQHIN